MSTSGDPPRGDTPYATDSAEASLRPDRVARFVRETIEAYASESVAEDIVRDALALAGLSALPTSDAALSALLEVHLVQAARHLLGDDVAEMLRHQLQPLVHIAKRVGGTERPLPPGAPEQPDLVDSPAPTRELAFRPFPVVLYAGLERDVVARLEARVEAQTAVIPVDEPATLVRNLRLLRHQARMLLVDLRRPHRLLDAVRNEPALLEGATVVLWGAPRGYDEHANDAIAAARIVRCAAETSVDDLAAVIRMGPLRDPHAR